MYRVYENLRTIHNVAFLGELASIRGLRIHVCGCARFSISCFILAIRLSFPPQCLACTQTHVILRLCEPFAHCLNCVFSRSIVNSCVLHGQCVCVCACIEPMCSRPAKHSAAYNKSPYSARFALCACVCVFVLTFLLRASRVFPSDISKIEFFRVQRIPCVSCITTSTH